MKENHSETIVNNSPVMIHTHNLTKHFGDLVAVDSLSLSIKAAVIISSRVNDPRVAEQLSTLVVLPLLVLFVAQTSGFIALGDTLIVWIAIALIVIDGGLLYFATRLFQRETILTRWK